VSTLGLVFAQRDGLLTEFDAATNGIVWTAELPAGSTVGGTPAVDTTTRTVFVVVSRAGSPILLGFDVDGFRNCNNIDNTCLPLFSAQVGTTNAPATPPLVDGGRVFVNGASSVYAFSASGQTICLPIQGTAYCNPLWSAATGFVAAGVGPAAASGVIYDAVKTGAIFGVRAFGAATGNTLWTGPLSAAVTATPSVDGARLFVPSGQAIPRVRPARLREPDVRSRVLARPQRS
jgi:PQQ-like domain